MISTYLFPTYRLCIKGKICFNHMLPVPNRRPNRRLVPNRRLTCPQSSSLNKPVVLEMNGSDLLAFFDDVSDKHFNKHFSIVARERFFGASGRFCRSPKLVLVSENRLNDAVEIAKQIAEEAKPGLVSDPSTNLIPIANPPALKDQIDRYASYDDVEIIKEYETVDYQNRDDDQGEFVLPIIVKVNKPLQNPIFMEEELFGPAIQIAPFKTKEKAAEIINTKKFNLRCSFHTNDKECIAYLKNHCRSGGLFFNLNHLEAHGGFPVGGLGCSCEEDIGARLFFMKFTKPKICMGKQVFFRGGPESNLGDFFSRAANVRPSSEAYITSPYFPLS